MERLVDWNCHLLPTMRGYVSNSEEALQAICLLYERYGFTHFHMMPEFDATREPVSIFLLRYKRALELFTPKSINRHIHIRSNPCVILSEGLHQTDGLDKLLIKNRAYLPLHMPITDYSDWIDLELNRLLFRKRFGLWFTSFEQAVLLYPQKALETMTNIQDAVFQFSYKALVNPKVSLVVQRLVKNNRVVLLGSGVDCLERAYQFDYTYYQQIATEQLSDAVYQTVLRRNHYFWTKVFSSH